MKNLKKIIICCLILGVIIVIGYFSLVKYRLLKEQDIVVDSDIIKDDVIISNEVIDENIADTFYVDIKGAVNNPGVYQVNNDMIVNDVIKLAGGLSKNADTSLINLSKKVTNEMVIVVYTKEEVKNSNIVDTVIKVVEKECVCPNIQNDGCLNDEIDDEISNKSELVNINTASLEELTNIPGIGESKAKAIIEYREKTIFNSIEDILNVSGIGNSLYEQIKIYITT